MKSEWQFHFEARGFHFEREHKFDFSSQDPVKVGDMDLSPFRCLVQVIPENDYACPPGVEQAGRLVFTLPLAPEKCDEFAHFFASTIADRLAFQCGGDLRVSFGLVLCRRIAETAEEETAIGDLPYGAMLRLEEVVASPSFEAAGGEIRGGNPINAAILQEFNTARLEASPVRRFVGLYRILENFAYKLGVEGSAKQVFKANDALRKRFSELEPTRDFDAFVDQIVDTRHRCSHLKLDCNFGYLHTDPEVDTHVVVHLGVLEALARSCLLA